MKYLILLLALFTLPVHANVLVIGDSISLGYTPYVKDMVSGVTHNGKCYKYADDTTNDLRNAGNSKREAACIEKWLSSGHYKMVLFNSGIHDTKNCGDGFEVSLSDYLNNLYTILITIRAHGAIPIFVTSTEIGTSRCHRNIDVRLYNRYAKALMCANGVETFNLYRYSTTITQYHKGAIHWTEDGYALLGAQVADFIKAHN